MLVTGTLNVTNDFMQGMLMGSSDLIYETKVQKLKVWPLDETHYGDEGAIMGDDKQELDEGDLDSNNDREEALNDPNIRIRQLSIGTISRPRRSHRGRRTTNTIADGNDSST